MSRADIGVFGSGAWGTALAITWARKGAKVALWGNFPDEMAQMAATRRHLRLKDVAFPEGLTTSDDPTEAFAAPLWISAMPTQVTPEAWAKLRPQAPRSPESVIHVSKGILQSTHQTLSQALAGVWDLPVGVLSGPSFADEVSRGVPTAIVLALPTSVPDARAQALQAQLSSEKLRIYLSRDVGLAGMGDLLLTATGPQSRNRTFGELVGKGQSVAAARDALGGQVIEGMFTTEAALALAAAHGLDLPIAAEVQRLLNGERPEEAVRRLMTRSLKSE